MDNERIVGLKANIDLLGMLLNRECNCDKARCSEHFQYMAKLKFDYECKLEDYEAEVDRGN